MCGEWKVEVCEVGFEVIGFALIRSEDCLNARVAVRGEYVIECLVDDEVTLKQNGVLTPRDLPTHNPFVERDRFDISVFTLGAITKSRDQGRSFCRRLGVVFCRCSVLRLLSTHDVSVWRMGLCLCGLKRCLTLDFGVRDVLSAVIGAG